MRIWAMTAALAVLGGTGMAQAQPRTAPAATPAEAPVVAEARRFMEGYARDLLAGNRAGIAARYDRRGGFILGEGRKAFGPYDRIVQQYASAQWVAPAAFEWRNLSFEPVGRDAVVVIGQFAWTRQGAAAPRVYSYTSLLLRQDGQLRIRLEHEDTGAETPPPAAPAH